MGTHCCAQPAEAKNNVDLNAADEPTKKGLEKPKALISPAKAEVRQFDSTKLEHKVNFDVGNGSKYTGQMMMTNDVYAKHGKGEQQWADGAHYIGDWRNNLAEGEGVFNHANGDVYTGEFYQDRANGFGVYVHSNGQKYEGFWKSDMQDGPGKEELEDGSKYDGMFK